MRKPCNLSVHPGFSLVELLVVIAVIAIIAAIAIPNIANITGAAGVAKNQRNAQTIASVVASARAAGWIPAGGNEMDLVPPIVSAAGVRVTNRSDTNQVMSFRVDSMSPADVTLAMHYLWTDGTTNLWYTNVTFGFP